MKFVKCRELRRKSTKKREFYFIYNANDSTEFIPVAHMSSIFVGKIYDATEDASGQVHPNKTKRVALIFMRGAGEYFEILNDIKDTASLMGVEEGDLTTLLLAKEIE